MDTRGIGGLLLAACIAAIVCGGCARAARDTQGFATTDASTVNVPLDQAWQMTKTVLRERELDIYTRDKRGVFVAFSGAKRHFVVGNHRIKFTIALESESPETTRITIEAVRQVFGVTLLTYPGWHDRKLTDNTESLAILDAIQAKAGGTPAEPADAASGQMPESQTTS